MYNEIWFVFGNRNSEWPANRTKSCRYAVASEGSPGDSIPPHKSTFFKESCWAWGRNLLEEATGPAISASKWLCEAASKEPSTPRNLGDPKTLVVCEPASTRSVSLSTSPHISSPMHCKSRLNLMAGKMLIHDASTIVHHSSYSRSTPGSKR